MPVVPHSQILRVHAAAIAVGLTTSRDALLAGLTQSLVAAFPAAANASAQLLGDLDRLNDLGQLPDGSVPLRTWLENALALCGVRREAEVFRAVLALLPDPSGMMPVSTAPAAGSAPAGAGGSTFHLHVHGSTIGSLAVGDGATSNGRVDLHQGTEPRLVPETASARERPQPLVALGPHVVAEGRRVGVSGNIWTVRLYRLLVGDETALSAIADANVNVFLGDRCLVLSHPGEARAIAGDISWQGAEGGGFEIKVPVAPPAAKRSVLDLKSIDLETARPVEGVAAGPVRLHTLLGTALGQLSDGSGTWISEWMRVPELRPRLSDLVRMEILRFASVPRRNKITGGDSISLAHVERVESVEMHADDAAEIEVAFVGGGSWKGRVWIATEQFEPPKIDHSHHLQQQVAAMRAAAKHEQSRHRAGAVGPAPSPPPATATTPAEASSLASVYLSYGDEDLPFARRLYEALENAGVSVFFREEHAALGAHHHRSARRSIPDYEHVILLCSERSLSAPTVNSELDEMLSREFDEGAAERIIPVLLDDFASTGWQPRHPDLRRAVLDRVALDMKGAEGDQTKFDKAMKRLLGALKG